MKQYLSNCKACKAQKPHYIYQTNIRKGVKLMCSRCGLRQKRYRNVTTLHEYTLQQDKNTSNEAHFNHYPVGGREDSQ